MQFNIPDDSQSIIKVIGVGGGGSNAVSYMYQQGIVGVDFAICNTDNQAMNLSPIPTKIQLGPGLTEGRGAGSKPVIGREACMESIEDVKNFFDDNTKMLFVTAGMGGGTGTGAAPVIAKIARELDILTVGIVTIPFTFEGRRRSKQAVEGISELKKNVDTLIVISNDKLRKIYGNLALGDAFSKADDILMTAAKGIAEIITVPGYVNVDFEDVNTVMRDSGVAVMGTAEMEGEDRAIRAVEAALQSPLLEENEIKGANHILLNIASGTKEVTMDEVFEITEFVQEEAGYGTDLIWGNCYDESLGEKIAVTIIATGFQSNSGNVNVKEEETFTGQQHLEDVTPKTTPRKVRVSLDEEDSVKKNLDSKQNTSKRPNYTEDNSVSFEFEHALSEKKKRGEEKDIYVSDKSANEEASAGDPEVKKRRESLEERKQRLKNLSIKLNNPEVLSELENQPAYLRRGVQLNDLSDRDDNSESWTVSKKKNTESEE